MDYAESQSCDLPSGLPMQCRIMKWIKSAFKLRSLKMEKRKLEDMAESKAIFLKMEMVKKCHKIKERKNINRW